MKYKVIFTKQAEFDLRRIYEYIAFSLYDPEIAAKQVDHIENAILKLNDMPERFPLFEKEPWYSRGFRKLPVNNFIVFYIPELEDRIVTVTRVMYGGREISEQLKKNNNNICQLYILVPAFLY